MDINQMGLKSIKGKCKLCDNKDRNVSFTHKLETILKELGKKYECEKCGYNKNTSAIHFHHTNPDEKDFELAEISKTLSLESLRNTITKEIEKCIILCSNCHMEEHYPHLNKIVVDS